MPSKIKHSNIDNSIKWEHAIYFKAGTMLCLLFICMFFVPAKASQQQKELINGTSKIVFSVADSSLYITEGKIIAAKGQSIRLLPGTHVKATNDESLAINIADKQQQEALAREEARRREARILAEVNEKRDNKLIPQINTGINSWCTKGTLPLQGSTISQQSIPMAAVSTISNVSAKSPATKIQSKTNIQNIHSQLVSMVKTFMPSRSWGNAAETIKVLRC